TDESDIEKEEWLLQYKIKTLTVFNKYDKAKSNYLNEGGYLTDLAPSICISAKHGEGIEGLKEALYEKAIGEQINTENTIVTNTRHYHALQKVAESLSDIQAGMEDNLPGDLLALDIRTCLHHLGTITGQITHEDQLDFIFSKFCIGK
ncbi:MAG: tRNA uridine-5-carboxymethylaminomethyl(34) synthesis GTPase MnmE, partial [Sphingobacteriaceae bacterium]